MTAIANQQIAVLHSLEALEKRTKKGLWPFKKQITFLFTGYSKLKPWVFSKRLMFARFRKSRNALEQVFGKVIHLFMAGALVDCQC